MPAQPAGRVTLVFTDIEGSTRLLQELGEERYRDALAEHRRLVRSAFGEHDGYEVDYEGDAFFYAFQSAAPAVAAVQEAMESLAGGPIQIRVGVHTGEPTIDPPKYVGLDVHTAARIMSAGHGGQVLVSKAALAEAGEPARHTDLGEHRLKDIAEPVWLFQLGDEQFPPLRTISNTNLPRPASSFVGRQRELGEVSALLQDGARLLTLSGPGGSGKTRLAIEAAAELVPDFRSGVFWVPLAALRDPAHVMPTIARTVGSKNGLAEHIGDREMLLVLDNLEQVVDSATAIAPLVESCRSLRVLVTSRERLRVRGETVYALPALREDDAVELFCARSGLKADDAIAELCERLDRLPLAIELAAARTNVLAPTQILGRLGARLDLLKGGRDAEARHETLRATIAWSHELLTAEEQQHFARISVFRGGCTLEAAEAVVDADVDTLQSLVDKNLLRRVGERFAMLETVHDFALGQLPVNEAGELRARHAGFYLEVAEHVESRPATVDRSTLLDMLEAERDNFRAALESAAAADDAELELRLVASLREFWEARGPIGEGVRYVEHAVRRVGDRLPERRLDALRWGALSALGAGDGETGERLATQAFVLAGDLGDTEGQVSSLIKLTHAASARGDFDLAHARIEQAGEVARSAGDQPLEARVLLNFGVLVHDEGDVERAAELAAQSIEVGGDSLDARFKAIALNNLASARIDLGQTGPAIEEPALGVLSLAPQHGDNRLVASAFEILAVAAMPRDAERAATLLGAAHALLERFGGEQDDQVTRQVLVRDDEAIDRAYRRGLELPIDQATSYALQSDAVVSWTG